MSTPEPRRRRRIVDTPAPVVLVVTVTLLLVIAASVGIFAAANSGLDEVSNGAAAESDGALEATVLEIDAATECPSMVFEAESDSAADELIEGNAYPEDPIGLWLQGIGSGAYAMNSIIVVFSLQTDLAEQVTVYDIQAKLTEAREPIQGGTVMTVSHCEGQSHEEMYLSVNAPDQGPFSYATEGEFFDEQTIPVSADEKPTVRAEVLIDGDYPAGAYDFTLAVTYEVDGESATVEVDNGGTPFRLAASECPRRVFEPDRSSGEHPLPLLLSEGRC